MKYTDISVMFKVGNLFVENFSPRGVILTQSESKAHSMDESVYKGLDFAVEVMKVITLLKSHGLEGRAVFKIVKTDVSFLDVKSTDTNALANEVNRVRRENQ